jgi:DhnA family fructose-bisphosphate aldolase class Ia
MKTRRLDHIFRPDGRALIIATEHAAVFGPCKGLEHPGETLEKAIAGGVDAVMTSFGIASHFARTLAPVGLILRADGASTIIGPDVAAPVWFAVEEALRFGADALCVSAFPGHHTEMASLDNLATVAREAHAWGLAMQAEMVPGGMDGGSETRTLENVALAARVGIELGADWVKVPYAEGFERVTGSCFKPVVIMGGSQRNSEAEILTEVRAAMDAGASGATIGRNIFQSNDPEAMTAALSAVIHQDASVEEAQAIFRRE